MKWLKLMTIVAVAQTVSGCGPTEYERSQMRQRQSKQAAEQTPISDYSAKLIGTAPSRQYKDSSEVVLLLIHPACVWEREYEVQETHIGCVNKGTSLVSAGSPLLKVMLEMCSQITGWGDQSIAQCIEKSGELSNYTELNEVNVACKSDAETARVRTGANWWDVWGKCLVSNTRKGAF